MRVGDLLLRIQGLSRGFATTSRFFKLYNHFTTYHPMFTFHDNSYISSRGSGSITHNDSFAHIPDSPGIASDYPSTSSMVAWAEKPHELQLTADLVYCDASQDDRLWMLSCAGVRAGEGRTRQRGFGNTQVLRNLLHMGQLDWAMHHKPAPHTIRSFQYSAALGEELLARIEPLEDRVSVFWVIHVDKLLTLSAEQSRRWSR